MPDYATANKVIMLAALAGHGQGKIRVARPEVAHVEAETEAVETMLEGIYVQSEAGFEYSGG